MKREEIWDQVCVGDIRELIVKNPTTIGPNESVHTLLARFNEDLRTRHVYVVDAAHRLIGVVRMNDIVQFLFPYASLAEDGTSTAWELSLNIHAKHVATSDSDDILQRTVGDIMNDAPYSVKEGTHLGDMAQILLREKINELPVVDDGRKIIGQVNVYEVIHSFLERMSE